MRLTLADQLSGTNAVRHLRPKDGGNPVRSVIFYLGSDGGFYFRHNYTDVASIDPDGRQWIHLNGWNTVTTRKATNNHWSAFISFFASFPERTLAPKAHPGAPHLSTEAGQPWLRIGNNAKPFDPYDRLCLNDMIEAGFYQTPKYEVYLVSGQEIGRRYNNGKMSACCYMGWDKRSYRQWCRSVGDDKADACALETAYETSRNKALLFH